MTEINVSLEKALIVLIRTSGSIFIIVNILVVILILTDSDPRGKAYRKFLLLLQISSMLFDAFSNAYAPIVQINCRLIYSTSSLAKSIGMSLFLGIEIAIFCQVVNSYFSCVYHRRNNILPSGRRFRFFGWRKAFLLISIQLCGWFVCATCFALLQDYSSEEVMNSALQWVTGKTTYLVIIQKPTIYAAVGVTLGWAAVMACLIAAMISELLLEIKNGMVHASVATKKYHIRAVFSLVFQGLVPALVYIVPICCEIIIFLYAIVVGYEVCTNNAAASTISAILFSLIFTHTFAHSITVLACAPPYRQKMASLAHRIIFCSNYEATPNNSITSTQKSLVDHSRVQFGPRAVIRGASLTRF